MSHFSDDLYLGTAVLPSADLTNPSLMPMGVGPLGRVYLYDIVPLTLQAAGLMASAAVAGAGNLPLVAGTGVTLRANADGTNGYVLDVPRCVTVTAAGGNTATFIVYGFDQYGQPVTANLAAPSTSTVATTKAFKVVTRIAISAAAGSNISCGFNDKFGLPLRVTDAGYVINVKWNNTLAADAGTLVVADQTATATASTTDVRGCYTPSSGASDGSKRLVMAIGLPALAVGPNATRIGAAGVAQF
jgi:hypothetical protein